MIKIYQCYYKKEQVRFLDPAFIPFDNTSNENPDLFIQELMLRNGHSEKDGHNYDQMLEKLILKQ